MEAQERKTGRPPVAATAADLRYHHITLLREAFSITTALARSSDRLRGMAVDPSDPIDWNALRQRLADHDAVSPVSQGKLRGRRAACLRVIAPGETVSITEIRERLRSDLGWTLDAKTASDTLGHLARQGFLRRVRQGRYARPAMPECTGGM